MTQPPHLRKFIESAQKNFIGEQIPTYAKEFLPGGLERTVNNKTLLTSLF